VNDSGDVDGISKDVLDLISEKYDVSFRWGECCDLAANFNLIKSGDIEMLTSLQENTERSEFLSFTAPYVSVPTVLLTNFNNTKEIIELSNTKLSVAVGEDYGVEYFLRKKYPALSLVEVENDKVGLQKLVFNEVDAIVLDVATASYFVKKLGLTNIRYNCSVEFVYHLSFAVDKRLPSLQVAMQNFVEGVSEEDISRIEAKWFGVFFDNVGSKKKYKRGVWYSVSIILLLIIVVMFLYRKVLFSKSEIEKIEKQIPLLLNSLNEAVFLHEVDNGTVVYVNDSMCKMYKVKKADVIGKSVGFLSSGEYPYNEKGAAERVKQAMGVGEKTFEWHAKKSTGELFWTEVVVRKIKLFNKKFALVSVRDIKKRKEFEDRIKNLNIELENRVQLRTSELQNAINELQAFSYTVSHDLRTPLRGINGFTSLIEGDKENTISGNSKVYIDKIKHNVHKMNGLIKGILAFSRIGRKSIKITVCDVNVVVRDIVEEYKLRPEFKDVRFVVADDFPVVNADKVLLERVFANLIDNAVKFSSKSSSPCVEIGVDKEKVFFVKDNGVGFDMRYLDMVFEVFHRLHSEKEFEGCGIGLSVVKRIIEKHNGKMWAESSIGNGAVFYFTFPQ
ncbi:MAG: transporter substrate-binding domain-containing protein, partial [Bacteroidota bacterium]|nr:transporter substrate-binding domain-containing protein [Bacteroidota bacterium]